MIIIIIYLLLYIYMETCTIKWIYNIIYMEVL